VYLNNKLFKKTISSRSYLFVSYMKFTFSKDNHVNLVILLANRDGTDKDLGMILPQTIATLAASSVLVPGLDNNLQNGIVSPFSPMLRDLLNHGFDSRP
jgi:hypothetical protein